MEVEKDPPISFAVDITDSANLTCGWLIQQTIINYDRELKLIAKQGVTCTHSSPPCRDCYLVAKSAQPRRKYLVGLCTQGKFESLDCWLSMYDRNLEPLKNGIVLQAIFASKSHVLILNFVRIQEQQRLVADALDL